MNWVFFNILFIIVLYSSLFFLFVNCKSNLILSIKRDGVRENLISSLKIGTHSSSKINNIELINKFASKKIQHLQANSDDNPKDSFISLYSNLKLILLFSCISILSFISVSPLWNNSTEKNFKNQSIYKGYLINLKNVSLLMVALVFQWMGPFFANKSLDPNDFIGFFCLGSLPVFISILFLELFFISIFRLIVMR